MTRYHDAWECDTCGSKLERGNLSPAAVERQMRRHNATIKHYVAARLNESVNKAWREKHARKASEKD